MASSINKLHRKKCEKMTIEELREVIRLEEPRMKILSSLVECAKFELKKRTPKPKG